MASLESRADLAGLIFEASISHIIPYNRFVSNVRITSTGLTYSYSGRGSFYRGGCSRGQNDGGCGLGRGRGFRKSL